MYAKKRLYNTFALALVIALLVSLLLAAPAMAEAESEAETESDVDVVYEDEGAAAACVREVIIASDDTFFDSARPSLSFGKDQLLLLRKTGTKTRQAYLKFELPAGTKIPTKATLAIFGSGEALDGTLPIKASAAPTNWNSDTLTYNARPAVCTNCLSATLATGQNPAWREVDVLPIVRDAINKRQASVGISLSLTTDGQATFNAIEAGTGMPKLNLQYGTC